jgi:uncharacterized protein
MSQGSDEPNTAVQNMLQGTPNGLGRLLAEASQNPKRGAPPLEKWNPAYCGEMDLRIDAAGEWFHEGTRMTRQSLVDLFATVLWREDQRYFLKTPVEKIGITVEDVPLLVVSMDQVTDDDGLIWLYCQTKTGDTVRIDAEHPIEIRDYQGEQRPYVRIRRNLDALIHRNAFYHLLELGQWSEDGMQVQLGSGSHVFCLNALG